VKFQPVKFLTGSLSGQIALVMAGALLVASAVNFTALMGERYRAGLIEQSGPAVARFVDVAVEIFARPPQEVRPIQIRPQGPGRYQVMPGNLIDNRDIKRDERLEQRLLRALSEAEVDATEIRAATRVATRQERGLQLDPQNRRGLPVLGDGPLRPRAGLQGPGEPGAEVPLRDVREIMLAARLPDGRWLNGMSATPEPPGDEILRLGASTFVTFAFVLGAALWVASRLSRPLRDLQTAASRVGAATDPEEVAVRGPGDVRQTLEAFNAMSRRVSQLLGEKDVMLGALGHDLRTPLASLRIRVETMEPEAERLKAIRTIEEATQLLEDILELARQGRSSEPVQTMDLSILVEDMVEDYAETGAPVSLAESEKAPVACRPVLFRRALRNLIDNAVAYGQAARLSVSKAGSDVLVRIEDDGPGMSDEALAAAGRPFMRGEASRSRSTGGAGLGLTLADAIAKAHGGELQLENRQPHGLSATIRLPLAASVQMVRSTET
jgi:signal transduction histidine kinase